ncbi:MAG: phage holin family protein [Cyclobacteriaceae bacterium]|jgi:uncharacterized membrane protein YqjE|nr:phage holin family protein [Cyclobacteriaceae bacterium]
MIKETLLKFFKLEGVFNHVNEYIETRLELFKYELKDDLARATAKMTVIVVITVCFTLFILLLSFSLAYYLSEKVGIFEGFAIVAGLYLLLALVFYVFRASLSTSLEAGIKKILHKHDHHDTGNGRPHKKPAAEESSTAA